MKLNKLRIVNYRSIVDSGEINLEPLQILVGENNSGKSNILRAIDVFLTAGKAGVGESCFFDSSNPILITATFTDLSEQERKELRKYLLGDKLILEKHLVCDGIGGSAKISAEYHGYESLPSDWWLSTEKINEKLGSRPIWKEVAEENGILEYVLDENGRVNKASYAKGIEKILLEREDIEYDEPELGSTQALGLPTYLVSRLPEFYLLPAITDYSSEIDRRSTTTVFRRLMGDLAERIIKEDPRYHEVESTINQLVALLNPRERQPSQSEVQDRLGTLETIEQTLLERVARLMPSVESIRLEVVIDEVKDFFSRGVELKVHDGVLTDVLAKGHGLQRCVVFGLLQALIANRKGELDLQPTGESNQRGILLAIEEPELYIHPQMQRMVYSALRRFAETDQVVYSTHSPSFVDVGEYQSIGVVRKDQIAEGTKVHQCEEGLFGTAEEKKGFQFINSFGLEANSLFFAKHTILVEGADDLIALVATGRKLGLFIEFPEEIGYTIIVTGGKSELPKFQKLLNAFSLPFTVWLEMDGRDETDPQNKAVLENLNGNKCIRIPTQLESLVGRDGHFGSAFTAKKFFEDADKITTELIEPVKEVFQSF